MTTPSPTPPNPAQWFADLLRAAPPAFVPWISAVPGGEASADTESPGIAHDASVFMPWLKVASDVQAWQRDLLEQMTRQLGEQTQQLTQQMSAWIPGFVGFAAAPGTAQGTVGAVPADRRFASDAWRGDPRFQMLAQAYLQQAEMLQSALNAAPLDERSKGQWSFVLRQVIDAASPANCLVTNPEAMQAALESGGASLAEGARLFLQDFSRGRISMTDEKAFEVGRNVALTPGHVVFENGLIQLLQYTPTTEQVYKRPLVIVPPCINKYYILDLQPENSLVAWAVEQGHPVFLVSWRNAGPEQAQLGWDDYLEDGVITAIEVAREIARSDRVNALGFCVGGTLLSCALAVLAARGEQPVASLTLLTTLLDFSDGGELSLMVTEQALAAREAAIGQPGIGGLLHGRELAQVFAALRSNDLIWPYVVQGYLKGKAPPAFDLLAWNSDDANLPGPMFCWYLRNAYLENKLREPGATTQCGEAVDFGRIDIPAFIYASREDHIVPWQGAYASTQLLGGDTRFVLGASGHIAGVINPPSKNKRNHWVGVGDSGAPPADPAQWLEAAKNVPGSWWTAWGEWLAEHAGAKVAVRKTPGSAAHPPLEPAPGRYVKEKAI